MTQDPVLQVAHIIPCTEAEGPGRRFALWFQGCPLRCPGCCNPEMLPFAGGQAISAGAIVEQLRLADVEGITLLGGEPSAHALGAAFLARAARSMARSVMVFSGFTLDELRRMPDSHVHDLLAHTDLLVDGPYLRERPETRRRWVGSANQQVHFLTDRYHPDDPCWELPNTLEIRLRGAELSVNGFPARSAVQLWQRLPGETSRTRAE